MTRSKITLEVGLAALMLAGMLFNAASASSPESNPAVGSARRALSPGTTLPSNVTHPMAPAGSRRDHCGAELRPCHSIARARPLA